MGQKAVLSGVQGVTSRLGEGSLWHQMCLSLHLNDHRQIVWGRTRVVPSDCPGSSSALPISGSGA